ncbi:MAG: TRAP transporter small permease [Xanthobacteraceae bacterium]
MLNAVDKLVRAVALYCGGIVLALLMAVILTDVVGRYAFNHPLFGSLDLATILLVLVVACAIGYGGRTGAHVTADMVTTVAGPTFDWLSGVAVKLLAAGIVAIWAGQLFSTGRVSDRLGETTQLLNIPYGPIYTLLSIGIALYALVLLVEAVVLAIHRDVPLLDDESRRMGSPE